MNVGSLFTGTGGFDLGLERAGHTIMWQCEADPYRRLILKRHWPKVPCHSDIRQLFKSERVLQGCKPQEGHRISGGDNTPTKDRGRPTGGLFPKEPISGLSEIQPEPSADPHHRLRSVELLCGGFPCQDLSHAGKRKGLKGERSGLFFEYMRIVSIIRPQWVLIENVPGLLSSNQGRDFATVLLSLEKIGYEDIAWRIFDSQYFGVPQRRRRVFILARHSSGSLSSQVLSIRESVQGDFKPGDKEKKVFTRTFGESTSKPIGSNTGSYRTTDIEFGAYINGAPTDPHRMRKAARVSGRVDHSPHDLKPDGRRYAAMGDAVTVPVAEWIGHRLNNWPTGC